MYIGMYLLFVLMDVVFTNILIILPFYFLFSAFRRKKSRNYFKNNVVINKKTDYLSKINDNYKGVYEDVPKSKLAKFNTDDINLLKDFFYQMFLDFENSCNNLDYNTMKLLSTKEVYNNYYTGTTLEFKAGRKKMITDIERKKVIIFELDSTIAKQIASVMIEISYLNYTIDKNGYIISGSKNKKITERFEVMFRKDFDRKELTKCPNCGAEIVGGKCEFCRSTIKNEQFKISSIKKIIDK